MILSLQGCMAVGKTTAVRYLQENAPYVNISYEINTDIIDEVKRRQLDKNKYEDYLQIQKLWLEKEIVRYNKAKDFNCSIMDFGAEEIEFYTLNYPITIGQEWEIENALHEELEQVRKCMPTRILFLDASSEVLLRHKENDKCTGYCKRFNIYMEEFQHHISRIEKSDQQSKRDDSSFHCIHIFPFFFQVNYNRYRADNIYYGKKYDKRTDHLLKIKICKHISSFLFCKDNLFLCISQYFFS